MILFRCADAVLNGVGTSSSIHTPLGSVKFDAVIDGVKTNNALPTKIYRLPSGGRVICWHQPKLDLELLICRPIPLTPSGILLTDCWAGLWRLFAKQDVSMCNLTATWEQDFTWKEQEPQSSQWVYAKTWNDGQIEVSVGTDDGDALAARSHQENNLPPQWEAYFRSTSDSFDWFSLQPIHYELGGEGLAVPLPLLATDQQCQIQFVVAWGPYQNSGTSTSLEVKRTATDILAGAGCS